MWSIFFFFSSRRRHTRYWRDWSSDVCSSDLVEKLVSKPGIEALDVAVLPGRAPLDVGRLGPDRRDPALHGLGHELGAVVRANVPRHTAQDEQVGQDIDHVDGLELASHPDGQALVRDPSTSSG